MKRGKIDQSLVTQMLGWQHSGFGVHHAVRLEADDRAGRERLTHYMLRCPFSLERLFRVTEQGTVIYLAEKKACRRFPKPAGGDLFDDVTKHSEPIAQLFTSPLRRAERSGARLKGRDRRR